MGGLRHEDLIERKLQKVEDIYDSQPANKKNILWSVLYAFRRDYAQSLCSNMAQCGFDMIQPYLIRKIITILQNPETKPDDMYWVGVWVTLLVSNRIFKYIVDEHDFWHNLKTGTTSAKVIEAMIFKKQLRLTPSTTKDYGSG